MRSESVRVAVRIRPLMNSERSQMQEEVTAVIQGTTQVAVGFNEDKSFTFDFAFGTDTTQNKIYDDCVTPLLDAFFEGFNATILAYGQTGSGKTYTMGSTSSARMSEEELGILPRVIMNMFDIIRTGSETQPQTQSESQPEPENTANRRNITYSVRCQFLEIYGEDINDLLDPTGDQVVIREGQHGEVNVLGAKEEPVTDADEMLELLEKGSLSRTTGSTLMNATSSRSHAIFTVMLEQQIRTGNSDMPLLGDEGKNDVQSDDVEIRQSKFHFVDLAGSERAKRTGAEGQRFKEGVEINKGLLTLGNVISALGDESKRGKVHVPYRDSKLTRMLQDSLGGNSRTLMICCVSPAECNMHETISALRYANRARNIQNKPIVNRDQNSTVISELKQQLQLLATELLAIRGNDGEGFAAIGSVSSSMLRDMASAFPSQPPSQQLTRGNSRLETSAMHREMAMLRSRATDAEAEVMRLSGEIKIARGQARELSDRIAVLSAEKDFGNGSCLIGMNVDDLSEAISSVPDAEEGGSHHNVYSNEHPSVAGYEEHKSSTSIVPISMEQGGKVVKGDAKQRVMAKFISLHSKCLEFERKLDLSERQRAQMERQLLSNSYASSRERKSSLSINKRFLDAERRDTESSIDSKVVERAEEQLRKERARRAKLLQELGIDKEKKIADSDENGQVDADDSSVLLLKEDSKNDENEDYLDARNFDELEEANRAAKLREKKMKIELGEIDMAILMKEELVESLRLNNAKYEMMEHHYEQKLEEIQDEVKRSEAEQQRLLEQLHQLERKSETEGRVEKQHLRDILAEKATELEKMKLRQREMTKLSATRTRDAARLKGLDEEISRMKKARVNLQRRLEEEKKKQKEMISEKTAEILALRRSAQRNAAEIRRLGMAKEKAESVSRRHLEELALLKRLQRQKVVVGRGKPLTAEQRTTKRWLDSRVREAAKREEAVDRLQEEYKSKLLLLQERENLKIARDSLRNRRSSAGSINLGDVNDMEMDDSMHAVIGHAPSISGLTAEEEETLVEVEDRLETAAAQLQFKDDKIRALEIAANSAAGEAEEGVIMDKFLKTGARDLSAAQEALRCLFTSLVSARRAQRQYQESTIALERELVEAQNSLEEAQEQAQMELRSYDQRLLKVEREHEEKLGRLMMLKNGTASSELSHLDLGTSIVHCENVNEYPALLCLANERNLALKSSITHLEIQLEEAHTRCNDLSELIKEERRKTSEKAHQADWFEYELKVSRSQYSSLRDQWMELRRNISSAGSTRSNSSSKTKGNLKRPYSFNNHPQNDKMSSLPNEPDEDYLSDHNEEDPDSEAETFFKEDSSLSSAIHAIPTGNVQEIFQHTDACPVAGSMHSGSIEGTDRHITVFERLASTNTQCHAQKLKDKDFLQERRRAANRIKAGGRERGSFTDETNGCSYNDDTSMNSSRNSSNTGTVSNLQVFDRLYQVSKPLKPLKNASQPQRSFSHGYNDVEGRQISPHISNASAECFPLPPVELNDGGRKERKISSFARFKMDDKLARLRRPTESQRLRVADTKTAPFMPGLVIPGGAHPPAPPSVSPDFHVNKFPSLAKRPSTSPSVHESSNLCGDSLSEHMIITSSSADVLGSTTLLTSPYGRDSYSDENDANSHDQN